MSFMFDDVADAELIAEVRRYRAAAVALYRFVVPSFDAFFTSEVMQDYSEAAFIEGDCPVKSVDLSMFVAPAPLEGRSLLLRGVRDRAAEHDASIERIAQVLVNADALARLLDVALGETVATSEAGQRSSRACFPADEHWALEESYAGIELAHFVS